MAYSELEPKQVGLNVLMLAHSSLAKLIIHFLLVHSKWIVHFWLRSYTFRIELTADLFVLTNYKGHMKGKKVAQWKMLTLTDQFS